MEFPSILHVAETATRALRPRNLAARRDAPFNTPALVTLWAILYVLIWWLLQVFRPYR